MTRCHLHDSSKVGCLSAFKNGVACSISAKLEKPGSVEAGASPRFLYLEFDQASRFECPIRKAYQLKYRRPTAFLLWFGFVKGC
jgi:hypothetical protein